MKQTIGRMGMGEGREGAGDVTWKGMRELGEDYLMEKIS